MSLLLGSISALLTASAAYRVAVAGMQPTSQLFGRTLVDAPETDAAAHSVALTFDDGPSERNTPALLDLLARHNVRATFFLVGAQVRRHPELARRIARDGHSIGNHTDTHPNLARCLPRRVRQELEACQHTMQDVTGTSPALFRPPFGARRPDILRTAASLGLQTTLWNVTAHDWELTEAADIGRHIQRGLTGNRQHGRTSTVLLHDGSHLDTAHGSLDRTPSLQAAAALLTQPGLHFITLDALLQQRAGVHRQQIDQGRKHISPERTQA